MGTSVLAAGQLATVLPFDCHATRGHRAVLINADGNIFLLVDRLERGRAGFKICDALRLGPYLSRCVHKDVIVSPDFFERWNVALQQRCAIFFDRLPDLLFALAVF